MSSTISAPPPSRGWRSSLKSLKPEPANSRLIGGSLLMLIGTGMVSAINFAYNVAVARMLGPDAFGHAAVAVTLLMILSSITLAFQLVSAKIIARNENPEHKAAVFHYLMRRAWIAGAAVALFLTLMSREMAAYLNLPSASMVVILAVGMAFYIPLGVKRGGFQGVCSFRRLAGNFILETLIKLFGAVILIQLGYGVYGAVDALTLSVIGAYLLVSTPRELRVKTSAVVPASFGEGMQAIVFFVGQVVINNVDVLLVKHFFNAHDAGEYAAIALVGRVVYQLGWSVVSAMFPISASEKGEKDTPAVLVVPLLLVLGISLAFTVGLTLFPHFAVHVTFGKGYGSVASISNLLPLYAAASGLYALAVVLMAYEMSRKIANGAFIQLAFSGATIVAIYLAHGTLWHVVIVQVMVRVGLLLVAASPFFRPAKGYLRTVKEQPKSDPLLETAINLTSTGMPVHGASVPLSGLKKIRRVPEAEVIAAFLRNEFYHRDFDRDRELFHDLVMTPDLTNDAENALRRALLFRRRATMWHELPADTQWWQVSLTRPDLERIYAFPRAHWRKLADGNFRLADMVERMRRMAFTGGSREFMQKILALSAYLKSQHDESTILLITTDESQPMTLIEGNHRMTAAMLAGPEIAMSQFRYICGFSPEMERCCWYHTNFSNLSRYAVKRLRLLVHDEEEDIQRWVASRQPAPQLENARESAARKTA
jgi:O-antigen/teichoic acid export membrane protein